MVDDPLPAGPRRFDHLDVEQEHSIATMRSPVVTGMLRSNTGGMAGSEASGMVNTVSVNGMLFSRKT